MREDPDRERARQRVVTSTLKLRHDIDEIWADLERVHRYEGNDWLMGLNNKLGDDSLSGIDALRSLDVSEAEFVAHATMLVICQMLLKRGEKVLKNAERTN